MYYFIKRKNEHIGDGSEKRLGVYPLYFFLMWTLERILFAIMKESLSESTAFSCRRSSKNVVEIPI